MINIYADFAEKYMAMPVLKGRKSANERFAGALDTYCIEALMQDGKALQAGTSHFLGQNFAKAFDVKFLSKENKLEYVWATSWGVSTRLIGALIMAHSDDNGLILPPKLAPIQVVIVPVYKDAETLDKISLVANALKSQLEEKNITVKYDDRDSQRSGWKFHEYELKGVPVRITIGPRDLENNQAEVFRRDTLEKQSLPIENLSNTIENLLTEIQQNMYDKALAFRQENTPKADTWEEFVDILENKGGFVSAHWDGTAETEDLIKEKTKATIRCIPFDNPQEDGKCILIGKPSKERVLFARAY
jgi:prolyl-tRNA synthetase